MKTHELKLDVKYFDEVKSGRKNFEIRKNDRGYEVDDFLKQHAWLVGEDGTGGYAKKHNNFLGYMGAWMRGIGNYAYAAEEADIITQRVKEVITAEQLNKDNWDDDTLGAMRNIDWSYVMKVLVDYFDIDQIPAGYVLMEVEVVK